MSKAVIVGVGAGLALLVLAVSSSASASTSPSGGKKSGGGGRVPGGGSGDEPSGGGDDAACEAYYAKLDSLTAQRGGYEAAGAEGMGMSPEQFASLMANIDAQIAVLETAVESC